MRRRANFNNDQLAQSGFIGKHDMMMDFCKKRLDIFQSAIKNRAVSFSCPSSLRNNIFKFNLSKYMRLKNNFCVCVTLK